MDPSPDGLLGWKVASGLSTLLSAIVGWIVVRTIAKVDALSLSSVTRPELATLLEKVDAMCSHAVTRPELNTLLDQLRDDRRSMHDENKGLMAQIRTDNKDNMLRLENRMDAQHRESNDRRHSLADRVQELSLRIGQLGRQDE